MLTCCSISVASPCPFSLRDVCCAWYERIFQKRNQLTVVVYPFLFHSLNSYPLSMEFLYKSSRDGSMFTYVLVMDSTCLLSHLCLCCVPCIMQQLLSEWAAVIKLLGFVFSFTVPAYSQKNMPCNAWFWLKHCSKIDQRLMETISSVLPEAAGGGRDQSIGKGWRIFTVISLNHASWLQLENAWCSHVFSHSNFVPSYAFVHAMLWVRQGSPGDDVNTQP